MEIPLFKKLNLESPNDSAILPKYMLQKKHVHTKTWTQMFIATLLVTQSETQMSINWWINKVWQVYIHTMDYYSKKEHGELGKP